MKELHNIYYPSPIGLINIFFTTAGVKSIDFVDDAENINDDCSSSSFNLHLPGVRKTCKLIYDQFNEYFTGKRKNFELPLVLEGSNFQLKVWKELQRIPYGETRSYGDIAAAINNPRAARAVGNANNKNPLAIIIPCHRVIGADGKLIGYAGQLWRKKWLLEHEKKHRKGEFYGQRIT